MTLEASDLAARIARLLRRSKASDHDKQLALIAVVKALHAVSK